MGAVYVVDQLSTGKQRALKVMAPELATDPAIRERFVLEARAASKIESDHVVEIVTAGVDEDTGAPFIVMELLKGEELADAAMRTGPLPLGDVNEILAQVGHALEQAHGHGIVHRDLKPENIFLSSGRRRDQSFTAKVLDFGIAKLVAEGQGQKTGTQPLGTPLFMSPEQTDRRGRITPATDVWALGLIAFRLLTGTDYWRERDGSLAQLLREIVVDELPFASLRANELGIGHLIPPGFDAWFARCVNRNIDARFAEAGECVRAFSEIVAIDAPRGRLVMPTGAIGAGSGSGTTGSVSGPVRVNAVSAPEAFASTGIAGGIQPQRTGDPIVSTSKPIASKPMSKAIFAIPVIAVVGIGAFFGLRGGSTPTPTPLTAPSGNAAMSAAPDSSAPVVSPGSKMSCGEGRVFIKGGKMFMGARDLLDDAGPPHTVEVSGFCLDKTEVTTEAYLACSSSSDCERALDVVKWPNITDETKKRYSPLCNSNHPDRGKHPINCVAWAMADTYCKKHKARLPTEAEWEFAARGSSQRKYPWGDDAPNGKRLNACGKECAAWGKTNGEDHNKTMHEDDDGFAGTSPVGSFPAGASADGILDLAGNVWEWTSDWYGPYSDKEQKDPKGPDSGEKRVARGGDFFSNNADWARPAWRWKTTPESYNHAIGFRCAEDPK
jgi:formylglycine-generating enzyme required for sulfatase activity/serine/threonine protein kinase